MRILVYRTEGASFNIGLNTFMLWFTFLFFFIFFLGGMLKITEYRDANIVIMVGPT